MTLIGDFNDNDNFSIQRYAIMGATIRPDRQRKQFTHSRARAAASATQRTAMLSHNKLQVNGCLDKYTCQHTHTHTHWAQAPDVDSFHTQYAQATNRLRFRGNRRKMWKGKMLTRQKIAARTLVCSISFLSNRYLNNYFYFYCELLSLSLSRSVGPTMKESLFDVCVW